MSSNWWQQNSNDPGKEELTRIYMSSSLWHLGLDSWQMGVIPNDWICGTWDFQCELNPSRIQATDPAAYARMKLEMAKIPFCHSDKDWSRLDTRCCGSKLFPWAFCASRIMEFDLNGTVHCVLCEKLPEKFEKQIKLQHSEWHEACKKLTAIQVATCIP